jgi:GNAT superfamily N-acetyltransferase
MHSKILVLLISICIPLHAMQESETILHSYIMSHTTSKTNNQRTITTKLFISDAKNHLNEIASITFGEHASDYLKPNGFIYNLYVREDFRNKKIGGSLLTYALQKLKELGYTSCFCTVRNYEIDGLNARERREAQEALVQWYKKRGWKQKNNALYDTLMSFSLL